MSSRIWLFALLMALSIHALGFVLLFHPSTQDGAKKQGEQGVEIDLGMLGDMGQQEESRLEKTVAAVTPEPEPEVIPDPIPPKKTLPPVEPKAQPKAKQESKVKVKAKPKPQPKVLPKAQVKPIIEPPTPAPSASTAKPDVITQQASRKQSTGKANALTTGGQAAATQSYFSLLVAQLIKHKHYPSASRRRGEEGIVKLYFVIDKTGQVLDYRINNSSGFARLDKAAIAMLKKAKLPAFTKDMTQNTLEINVPIAFHLNNR